LVNCSSLGGLVGPKGGPGCLSRDPKHGVIGADKERRHGTMRRVGIRINAVCPRGVIDTPMGGGMGPDVIKEIMRDQPIARLGPSRRDRRVGSPGSAVLAPASYSAWPCRFDGGFTAH